MTDTQATAKVASADDKINAAPQVRAWPFIESNLSEVEGRMVRALRRYRRAEVDPVFAGEVEATVLFELAMGLIAEGKESGISEDWGVTPGEVVTLRAMYPLWRRWANESTAIYKSGTALGEAG